MNKKTANKIFKILNDTYSRVTTALVYKTPLELLVSTILSAQCTDVRVNIVTKELFKKYRTVKDYAQAELPVFEQEIRSTGFYRNKARNIISTARMLISDFGAEIPAEMESLIELPGVARKTANIVLFHAYGKTEGVAVDTHVKRVSARLGLTKNTDPKKIEKDLMGLFDRKKWGMLSSLLIAHGRKVCDARKPLCASCMLQELCPSNRGMQ
ncbi:MAG: endonuclease III [Candidatus Omnitrophica bacterium]|nr:endonuclease III [Candidatus Omnitrophota bacterium]MBU1128461.1 endonuclease III [Candidatus Omnitrophota bacterium]MBU1656730.1 endonuclease III [Candidatus Omnitrophota bacterium]MBU1784679.1 endonuclease III [Candidatus Omnitrophota bacterium]MBU1851654.1 endonuclease III [Candidatus Omnitrophota bacterium]